MDLQTLEAQVYNVLRDAERAFFDKEEVDNWLNEGQLDLAVRLNLLQHEWTGTTSDDVIDVPEDLVSALSLRVDDAAVKFVDDETFNDFADAGDTPPVTIAREFAGVFQIYPGVTEATDYAIRGVQTPDTLVNPQDVPQLPAHLHPKLLHYARYQALMKEGSDRWQSYAALYSENLPPPPTGIVRLQPGPFQLVPAPGPFDSDPDSTHQ
jgi:hypothetical protein